MSVTLFFSYFSREKKMPNHSNFLVVAFLMCTEKLCVKMEWTCGILKFKKILGGNHAKK